MRRVAQLSEEVEQQRGDLRVNEGARQAEEGGERLPEAHRRAGVFAATERVEARRAAVSGAREEAQEARENQFYTRSQCEMRERKITEEISILVSELRGDLKS